MQHIVPREKDGSPLYITDIRTDITVDIVNVDHYPSSL